MNLERKSHTWENNVLRKTHSKGLKYLEVNISEGIIYQLYEIQWKQGLEEIYSLHSIHLLNIENNWVNYSF